MVVSNFAPLLFCFQCFFNKIIDNIVKIMYHVRMFCNHFVLSNELAIRDSQEIVSL